MEEARGTKNVCVFWVLASAQPPSGNSVRSQSGGISDHILGNASFLAICARAVGQLRKTALRLDTQSSLQVTRSNPIAYRAANSRKVTGRHPPCVDRRGCNPGRAKLQTDVRSRNDRRLHVSIANCAGSLMGVARAADSKQRGTWIQYHYRWVARIP